MPAPNNNPPIRHRGLWSGTLIPAFEISFQFIVVMLASLSLRTLYHHFCQHLIQEIFPQASKTAGFKILEDLANVLASNLIDTASFKASVKRPYFTLFDQYLGKKLATELAPQASSRLPNSRQNKGGVHTLNDPQPTTLQPSQMTENTPLTTIPAPQRYRTPDYRPCLLEYQANLKKVSLEPTNLQYIQHSINHKHLPNFLFRYIATLSANQLQNSHGFQRLMQKAQPLNPFY